MLQKDTMYLAPEQSSNTLFKIIKGLTDQSESSILGSGEKKK